MNKLTIIQNIIQSLRSPLGFIAFAALILECILGVLMITTDINRAGLLIGMSMALMISLMASVYIVLFFPHTLHRPALKFTKLSSERTRIQNELKELISILDRLLTDSKGKLSMNQQISEIEKQQFEEIFRHAAVSQTEKRMLTGRYDDAADNAENNNKRKLASTKK